MNQLTQSLNHTWESLTGGLNPLCEPDQIRLTGFTVKNS